MREHSIDLFSASPEVALELVGVDPRSVASRSHQKMLWRCPRNHDYLATPAMRTQRGQGCPYCSNRQVLIGFNDLASTHPMIAEELQRVAATSVSAGSGRRVTWRCKLGHEWESPVRDRTLRGQGCPICSNQMIQVGWNDLGTTHPELAKQLLDASPTSVTAGSKRRMRWRCPVGHEWHATVASRAVRRTGCPVCTGRKVEAGFNDLASTHPRIAAELVGESPTTIGAGSHRRVTWCCPRGHRYATTPQKRTARSQGCPYCANQRVLVGFNDLATTDPALAEQLLQLDPTLLTAGSRRRVQWRCNQGHEWSATVSSRSLAGHGCPFCAGKRPTPGVNDLATVRPDLAAQLVDTDPVTVMPNSSTKLRWRCDRGHEWRATPNNRSSNESGCPYCSGRLPVIGETDLLTVHPEVAAQMIDDDPRSYTSASSRRARWRCASGHEWVCAVSDRANGSGCPTCALTGFDPNREAWIYLLRRRHDERNIGITGDLPKRLRQHAGQGSWTELLDSVGPLDGTVAQDWEKKFKAVLRARGHLLPGSTEQWETGNGLDAVTLKSLSEAAGLTPPAELVGSDRRQRRASSRSDHDEPSPEPEFAPDVIPIRHDSESGSCEAGVRT